MPSLPGPTWRNQRSAAPNCSTMNKDRLVHVDPGASWRALTGSRCGLRRLPELSGIREAGTGTHSSSGNRNLTISGFSDSETSERCSETSGSGPSTSQTSSDRCRHRHPACVPTGPAAFTVATPARFIATASVCRTRCRSARFRSPSHSRDCWSCQLAAADGDFWQMIAGWYQP